MIGINTVAVIKNSEQSFKIFDAYSRDLHLQPNLSIKDKKLQMNQQNVERRDC